MNPQHDVVNPPGQINNTKELDKLAYKSNPKTLGDIIDNVLYSEKVNYKKKLTFDEWFQLEHGDPRESNSRYRMHKDMEISWKAAQENM